MTKKQHNIKLYGCKSNGIVAKTHEADKVVYFTDINRVWRVITVEGSDTAWVKTDNFNMTYKLKKHGSITNLWTGKMGQTKTHFTKKKVVAKLIYWSE